jgi:hypothetical protein
MSVTLKLNIKIRRILEVTINVQFLLIFIKIKLLQSVIHIWFILHLSTLISDENVLNLNTFGYINTLLPSSVVDGTGASGS